MSTEQAPECCPFCGAAMMGTRSTDGEYARYKCGNAFDARNASTREMQSKHCATAERERLTRERDGIKAAHTNALNQIGDLCMENAKLLARVKRLEEAGDAIVDHNIGCGCGQDGPCRACRMACEAWRKAKEAKS